MIVRPASLADRAAVLALAQRFHAAAHAPGAPYTALLTYDAARVPAAVDDTLATGVVLVVELEHGAGGDELVAFLGLLRCEHALSGELYADGRALWIEPPYRSGLLTGWLLRQAEAWAAAQGCAFLKLGAPVGTKVGTYFARCGYSPVETAFIKRVA
jgi:GNAT superfamily N-acetyltransferase